MCIRDRRGVDIREAFNQISRYARDSFWAGSGLFEYVQLLKRDDGSTKNITLLDKTNIHNNRLQVINQYEVPGASSGSVVEVSTGSTSGGGRYANRYDVTILVNGLPMVHVELKRRGVDIREAVSYTHLDVYKRQARGWLQVTPAATRRDAGRGMTCR